MVLASSSEIIGDTSMVLIFGRRITVDIAILNSIGLSAKKGHPLDHSLLHVSGRVVADFSLS